MNLASTGLTPGANWRWLPIVCMGLWMATGWACAADSAGAAPAAVQPEPGGGSANPAPAPENTAPATPKHWIRGSLDAGFDAAWDDKTSDIDFEQYLRLQVDPPVWDKLHLRGALWMIENAVRPDDDNSPLRDIDDASSGYVHAKLPYLYADIDDLWGDSVLRVGRQRILEGVAFNRVDGVYFKQNVGRWNWYVFGGTRASYYRTPFRDPAAGAGASVQATPTTRLALDTYYGHENRRVDFDRGPLAGLLHLSYPRDVQSHISDTAFSLSAWQTVCEALNLFGRFTWYADGSDELTLNATGYIQPLDLTYEATYRRQLNSFSDRVNDLTGFYRIMGTSVANDTWFLALHRPLTKKLTLSMEGEWRDAHDADWLTANRDYQRYAAILSADNICHNIGGQIAVERWNVTDGEGTWAVTGEITKRWPKVDLAVGADYQRYTDRLRTYDSTQGWITQGLLYLAPKLYVETSPILFLTGNVAVERHENLHSFYVKTKWRVCADQDLNAKVSFETDEEPESPYWRVQANYEIRF